MKLATAAFPSLLLGTAVASSALSVSSSEITPASPHTIVAGSRSSTIVHAVPRALDSAHRFALRHSRSVAQDLRAALGGLIFSHQPNSLRRQLSPRQQNGVYDGGSGSAAQKVLYCKAVPPKFGSTHGGVNEGGSGINGGPSPTGQGGGNSTNPTTGSGHTGIGSGQPPAPTQNVPITSPWKLVEAHEGGSFFDGWDFFTGDDPTHGTVDYINSDAAWGSKLIEVNERGNIIMRVDTSNNVRGRGRQSVRIHSKTTFNGGLVVMDSIHMPTGCGTWPAFWTNGPSWPVNGEIDIVEGVHDYTNNQATIHTDAGCRLSSSNSDQLGITGNLVAGTDCSVHTTGNQGCGIRAAENISFGSGFNRNGGGVYAMKWDNSGVSVYFFPAGTTPADIEAGLPQPDNWGRPQARWPADQCDPWRFFTTHQMIFDTTFCGDWAAGVWGASGIPGQEQSCAQRTGFSSCEAFVRARGSSFTEAYWEVRSVKLYQLA